MKYKTQIILASLFFLSSVLIHFSPFFKKKSTETIILSSLTGQVKNDGNYYKILKKKIGKKIFLEIFNINNIDSNSTKILLQGSFDAHYDLVRKASNLFLKDINGDQIPEIFAPTYDYGLKSYYNIYSYSVSAQTFLPIHLK